MVMISLAMKEDEYGKEVTGNGPKKREYVSGHMFVYFFIESLLFLFLAMVAAVILFIKYGFSIPTEELIFAGAALLVSFFISTYVGEVIVKKAAQTRYDALSKARKAYKKDLNRLEELLENEF